MPTPGLFSGWPMTARRLVMLRRHFGLPKIRFAGIFVRIGAVVWPSGLKKLRQRRKVDRSRPQDPSAFSRRSEVWTAGPSHVSFPILVEDFHDHDFLTPFRCTEVVAVSFRRSGDLRGFNQLPEPTALARRGSSLTMGEERSAVPVIIVPEHRKEEIRQTTAELADLGQRLSDRITTLAAAILAFSVAFSSSIAGGDAGAVWLLRLSWILQIISLTCLILFGYMPIHLREESLDRILKEPDAALSIAPPKFFIWLFRAGLFLFLLSLVSLVAYAVGAAG